MGRYIAAAGIALVAAFVSVLVATNAALESSDLELAADGTAVLVPDWGERGSWVLRYEHDARTSYTFRLRNRSRLPITVTSIGLPTGEGHHLLEATDIRLFPPGGRSEADDGTTPFSPFRLRPGEERAVLVHARFGSCEYYTERALEVHDTHPITYRGIGVPRTQEVSYPHELVVRSPTIQNCPDRLMDRSSHRRTDEGN